MAYILLDGRGTASISAAAFAERLLLVTKQSLQRFRLWASLRKPAERLLTTLTSSVKSDTLTHGEVQTFVLREGLSKANKYQIRQTKGVQYFSWCFKNVDISFPKAIYLIFSCFFTLWLSTEFSQCGKPKRIFCAYETLSLTILTLACCQKFAQTQWICFHSHDYWCCISPSRHQNSTWTHMELCRNQQKCQINQTRLVFQILKIASFHKKPVYRYLPCFSVSYIFCEDCKDL